MTKLISYYNRIGHDLTISPKYEIEYYFKSVSGSLRECIIVFMMSTLATN